jgi:hypothetical protein
VYRFQPVVLRVDETFPVSTANAVREQLKDMRLISFNGQPELLFTSGEKTDALIIASNGYVFDYIKKEDSGDLRQKVIRYCQSKSLRNLQIKDADLPVDIKLIPYLYGNYNLKNISSRTKYGRLVLNVADSIKILISNQGSNPVYVNILDIQPDGVVNAVLPYMKQNRPPSDAKILPGSSIAIEHVRISNPCGTEVLKIFVSKMEINMEPLVLAKGDSMRGDLSFLEQLLQDTYKSVTRGPATTRLRTANGSAFNVIFEITAKQ